MIFEILGSAHDLPSAGAARAAIVTVVIGEVYERTFSRMCAPGWTAYARKIGVDVIVLKQRIDAGDVARSPAWQKLLILGQPWARRYERIIWLDSDIIVTEAAPDILEFAGPVEKIGVCEDSGRLSSAEAQAYLEGKTKLTLSPRDVETSWRLAMRQIYINNRTPPHETMFNTGVMVPSPAHHEATLRSVYPCAQTSHLCEQPELSHGLIGDETPEFMAQVMRVIVRSQLKSAYFLHFYGAMTLLTHYADNFARLETQTPVAAE